MKLRFLRSLMGPVLIAWFRPLGWDRIGGMEASLYHFLSRLARVEIDPALGAEIRAAARALESENPRWEGVADLAEAQGLGPLIHHHLRPLGVTPPVPVGRQLLGLYLRHRDANEIRLRALDEIVAAMGAAGVPVLLLKGAALARRVYPEPGLRPMGDMDLLVPGEALPLATETLHRLGFRNLAAADPPGWQAEHRHAPALFRGVEGLLVQVELHTDLFAQSGEAAPQPADPWADPLAFRLPGAEEARSPSHEVMLLHLCWHLVNLRHDPAQVARPRLIWVTDILGYAQRFAEEIDWPGLRARRPFVWSALALLGQLTPLPESVRRHFPPPEAGRRPRGVGEGYRGWPACPLASPQRRRLDLYLRDTFWPPEWWLRLHYGLGPAGPLVPTRWLGHPGRILRGVGHKLARDYLNPIQKGKHP